MLADFERATSVSLHVRRFPSADKSEFGPLKIGPGFRGVYRENPHSHSVREFGAPRESAAANREPNPAPNPTAGCKILNLPWAP